MPEIRKVGAWITTRGGADVEEYGLENLDDDTVSCYVASDIGQEFMIRVKNAQDELLLFRVNIDGHSLTGKLCEGGVEKCVDGLSVSSGSFRPFVFTPWTIEGDNAEASGEGCSAWHCVGLIEIRVYRARIVGHDTVRYHSGSIRTKPIREECQKAGMFHHFKLGDVQTSQRPERCRVDYVDAREEPLARFQFRYRSLEVLESLGLLSHLLDEEFLPEDVQPKLSGRPPPSHITGTKRKSPNAAEASSRPIRRIKPDSERHYPIPPFTPVKAEPYNSHMADDGSDLELEVMEERLKALQSAIQRKKAKRDSRMSVLSSPIRVPPNTSGGPVIIDLT